MLKQFLHIKSLIIIALWVIGLNIFYEFLLIFMFYHPFSRIGAITDLIGNSRPKNYTDVTSVSPDELLGTWKIDISGSSRLLNDLAQDQKTHLTLHPDQTFELEYPVKGFYDSGGDMPSIPSSSFKPNSSSNQIISLKGQWGTVTQNRSNFPRPVYYSTRIVGKYEGDDEYMLLGDVLDTHDRSPMNRFTIKWQRGTSELGPDPAIYLKKSENHHVVP